MSDFTVTTNDDEAYDGGDLAAEMADGGGLSLREALALADADADVSSIEFDDGLAGLVFYLTLGALDVATEVTILGDTNDDGVIDITLSGDVGMNDIAQTDDATTAYDESLLTDAFNNIETGDNGGVLVVGSTGALTLDSIALTGAEDSAVKVEDSGQLVVTNSLLSGNFGVDAGGIFLNENATLNLSDSDIVDNIGDFGGGLSTLAGSMAQISNTLFAGNLGLFAGVMSIEGTLTITDSSFEDNESINDGGAIAVEEDGDVTVSDSTFTGNLAGNDGGAIRNDGTLTVTNSTFSGNTAEDDGGGLENAGTATVTNSTFTRNVSEDDGGAINHSGDGVALTLTNTTLHGNSAMYQGGGLDADSDGVTITNSTITGNEAIGDDDEIGVGGGINVSDGVSVTLANSIVAGNAATAGGGIYGDEDDITVETSSLVLNGTNILGEAPEGFASDPDTSGDIVLGDGNNFTIDDVFDDTETIGSATGGALADNGGNVETVALLGSADNPAINGGDNSGVDSGNTTSPNGDDRIAFLTTDIGAFEFPTSGTIADNQAPEVEIEGFASTDDGDVGTGLSFSASDGNDNPLTIELSRTDADLFELGDGDSLLFITPPDPVAPTDRGENGVYTLTYTATDGFEATIRKVKITVEADGDIKSRAYQTDNTIIEKVRTDISDSRNFEWTAATYDDEGRVESRVYVYDDGDTRSMAHSYAMDGSSTVTATDGTGSESSAGWSERVVTFDAEGNLTGRDYTYDDGTTRSTSFTYVDGERSTGTFIDGTGAESSADWTRIDYTYNGDGNVLTRDYVYDDGTTRSLTHSYDGDTLETVNATDGTGAESSADWAERLVTYDAAGRVVGEDFVYDDGTSRSFTYSYDGDNLTGESITDGTGDENSANWSTLDITYTDDGDILTREYVYDDGTTRSLTHSYDGGTLETVTGIDGTGAESSANWAERVTTYDDDGNIIRQDFVFDDGSTRTDTFTVADSFAASLPAPDPTDIWDA